MFNFLKRVFGSKPEREKPDTEPKRKTLEGERLLFGVPLNVETQPADNMAEATLSSPAVRLPEDTPTPDDTKPTRPVAIQEPPVAADDTKPRPPVPPPAPPRRAVRRPRYPDFSDPYAGLFPPPQPGDDDYFETAASDDDTPPSGLKPHHD